MKHENIYQAMVAIMGEADPISKSRTNTGQGYKFRGIDDVYQSLQQVMQSHGVFMTTEISSAPVYDQYTSAKGTLTFRTRATFRFFFHHESGTSVQSETIGEGMDTGDKASNKAMSVAHKYALLQAFMIPTEDAKDPEDESHEIKPAPVGSTKARTAPERSKKWLDAKAKLGELKKGMTDEQIAAVSKLFLEAGDKPVLIDNAVAQAEAYVTENVEASAAAIAAGFGGEVVK